MQTFKRSNGFRKRCCSYIRHCYGNRCHNSRKVCKTGKLFTYSTIKECHNEKVVKGWRRKVCCSGAKVCAGSKCKTLRRICKVTKKRVETDKHKKITLLRIKKWKEEKVVLQKKITDECNCYLQEKENLQFFREKRTKFSKKYQKCRKVKIEKRCVKFFDKLNYFAEKSTKQRALRNKKNTECSSAKLKYKAWLKKVELIKKKYADEETQLKIKERTTLVKRFAAIDLKYKKN